MTHDDARDLPNVLSYQVLFATHADGRPTAALLRAVAMALRMSARLTVLLVATPRPAAIAPLFPRAAARELERGMTIEQAVVETTAWVAELAPSARVLVREGSFTQAVVDVSIEHEVDLVVVSDEELEAPEDLLFVVHAASVPTLLARPAEPNPTVVAATDLRSPEAPVLRAATGFAEQFEAPVVAVHNVPLVTVTPGASVTAPTTTTPTADDLERRGAALSRAVATLDGTVEPLIVSEPRTADAVHHAAREREADLLVIGTYDGSWLERALFGSTAAQILRESRRSVLVLPLQRRPGRTGAGSMP